MSVDVTESLPRSHWANTDTLRVAAYWVMIVAGSWWVLGQLAMVLRPLLLAAFLGYVLMPYYRRLNRNLSAPIAIGLLAGLTTLILVGLSLAVYSSLLGLKDDLPALRESAITIARNFKDMVQQYVPMLANRILEGKSIEDQVGDLVTEGTVRGVNVAAGVLLEAATAGLYLLFLLLESARFPDRIRTAYPHEQAENILNIAGRINSAIISYLKAKVFASFMLALPVWIVLMVFGVKFALLWAILTFLCNFIPYLGSVVAYSLPVAFAFLQHELGYKPISVAVLLLACHIAVASLIEPTIIGRAVGISPLVILAALSMWGLLWGLPGMFLAVPLTVVLKIIFENIEVTRPMARLLSGG